MQNRQVQLAAKPTRGIPQAEHFAIVSTALAEPGDGQILVKNQFLSVEPAMRGWIMDRSNYAAPIKIGTVMRSLAVGQVIASRHADYRIGQIVTGWFGWQDCACVDASAVVRVVDAPDLPASLALGVLGINGLTAYLGLLRLGLPQAGDVVAVSTAAGAVGSAVGQIAKIIGCTTIGITGGAEKQALCLEEFGFDAAIDYKSEDVEARIGELCPNGVNVYFDNTSGAISDAIIKHVAVGARIVICGTASISSWDDWPLGPRVERHLLVKRARMQGFLVFDHRDEFSTALTQLADWVRTGRLRYREDRLQGLEACPGALAWLYSGANMGKCVVELP